jgi:hypothetical protein
MMEFVMYRYLYCITGKLNKPLINVVGIGNANVHALQYEDIVAILSEVVTAKIPVSNGNVLRHAAVIEAVRKEQTVLPMRYSSVFKNDVRVIEFLKNRYATFISDLERLHDKLEMGIRVIQKKVTVHPHLNLPLSPPPEGDRGRTFSPSVSGAGGGIQVTNEYSPPLVGVGEQLTESPIHDPQSPASTGMSYLQQRRIYYASQDENDEWVQEIVKTCHAQFEDICVEFKRDNHSPFLQGVSLNYLIHRNSLNEFKNRFNNLKSSLNELHFLCSGPWPPYHFVSPE